MTTEGTIERVEEEIEDVARGELGGALVAAPGLLPGEVRPHPTPLKYVMIAVVLVIVTAFEIAVSYLEGDIPDSLIVTLLMIMMVVKFAAVASWYMHLRTDKPIFHRFFILGVTAPIVLYAIVLASLDAFS
jgi:caa(3)-type oxidase subunit IV